MGRHATREIEVDRLLRGKVFVDLFRAVRQGLRASVESYSIKKLEPLYGLAREEGLHDAGSSIVAFESWLAEVETGTGGAAPRSPQTDATLRSIEAYNRDDCVSNWRLRDWLEERRQELAGELGEPLPRPGPAEPEATEELSDHLAHVAEVAERLCAGVPEEEADRTPEQHAPLAAGPAAELASARGQGVLVALLPPDERPHRRGANRRTGADRRAGPDRMPGARGALHGVPVSLPRAGACHRRRDGGARPGHGTIAWERGGAGRGGGHAGSAAWAEDGRPASHLPRAERARRHGAAPRQPASDRRVGRGARHRGAGRVPRRPRAAAPTRARRPRRRGAVPAGRTGARRRAADRAGAGRRLPGGPGPARLGQDVSGRGGDRGARPAWAERWA